MKTGSINYKKLIFVLLIGLMNLKLCWADIAIVVHPENPVSELSAREVKKLFLGRMRQYPGTNLVPQLLDQASENPVYQDFYQKVLGFRLSKLRRYRAAYLFSGKGALPNVLPDTEAVILKVSETLSAIGYVDVGSVDERVKVVYVWVLPKKSSEHQPAQ